MKYLKLYQQYLDNEKQMNILFKELKVIKEQLFKKKPMDLARIDLERHIKYVQLMSFEMSQDNLLRKIFKTEHYINNCKMNDHIPTFLLKSIKEVSSRSST